MEADARDRHRGTHRVRRLACPAAAHLPARHRPLAAFLCGEPLHLQHGPPSRRRSSRCWARTGQGILANYADPVPQALVLTAIVIGFATTALLLVVLLVARGLTGSDHVDGRESR